jgi:5-dehydro-2-deoxygluconokinase
VLSGVGNDGHGRFLVRSLEAEGVDTRWVTVHPTLRTALAFCELWPPDRFPLTAYRMPTCPDWELRVTDLPIDLLRSAPLLYVSGTALAREPSRSAAMGALEARREGRDGVMATVIDLDWRREYWEHPEEYPVQIRLALQMADTVIGGESEFQGAGLSAAAAMEIGPRRAFVKRGPDGAAALEGDERDEIGGIQVEVVNGLGAGDAFAAAVGYGMLTGMARAHVLRFANAAGAMVTRQLPCAAAMPHRHELEAFVRAQP